MSEILHWDAILGPPDLHLRLADCPAVDVDPGMERLRYDGPEAGLVSPGGWLGLIFLSVMKV